MLYGIGCDVCSLTHLEKSLSGAHADAFVRRVFGPAEQTALALELPLPAGRGTAHRLASAAADFAVLSAGHPGRAAGKRCPGVSVLRCRCRLDGCTQADCPPFPQP